MASNGLVPGGSLVDGGYRQFLGIVLDGSRGESTPERGPFCRKKKKKRSHRCWAEEPRTEQAGHSTYRNRTDFKKELSPTTDLICNSTTNTESFVQKATHVRRSSANAVTRANDKRVTNIIIDGVSILPYLIECVRVCLGTTATAPPIRRDLVISGCYMVSPPSQCFFLLQPPPVYLQPLFPNPGGVPGEQTAQDLPTSSISAP
ncbi:hypothetical protein MAPG_07949 [Magnaporthiopsis poae ATCC 64411]|uniref:Uncharacterized protein n=1 Tax=Magnaporthiopsis poae (strain ATCC 64411 / 73-15) TaxID=644358 RepID=A0A0C4E620_MAGP6|nr:hypothetical protein MAPG_07949 [Magnaporthiopsis poae ATCC 64411]